VTELDVGHVLVPELRLELEAAQITLGRPIPSCQ